MKIQNETTNTKSGVLVVVALLLASFPALAQSQSAAAETTEPLPGYPVDSPAAQQPAQGAVQQPQARPPVRQISPPRSDRSSNQTVPAELMLPAGTVFPVRVTGWLSSEQNHVGDAFSASLDQPLVVNGWVIARQGQTVVGRVTRVKKAGHFGSVSELGLELSMITLVDGQQVPVQTKLVQSSGRSTTGSDVAAVGVTSGLGAAVGAAADGGYGAGLGAGIGAVAGLAGVMISHGSPTVVRPETLLPFQIESPITVNTEHRQFAFQLVRPSDFRGDQDAYAPANRPRLGRPDVAYPPPAVYPYPYYPNYGWGYYPGPVIGLGFEFGPRYGYYGRGYGRGYRGGFRR